MVFVVLADAHKRRRGASVSEGFTLVEAVVAIVLVGIGITSTVTALTKLNEFASTNRNYTGAYTLAMNQIDLIQSATGVPQNLAGKILFQPPSPPLPSPPLPPVLTDGKQTLANVPIYEEPNAPLATRIVSGTVETDVKPIAINGVTTYQATVTVSWQRGTGAFARGPIWSPTRNRWEHQLTMCTVRASDQ